MKLFCAKYKIAIGRLRGKTVLKRLKQMCKNKTLWERILGRRCIRHIRINISWEFACTSVQGLMIGSTEYWDSLVCR